MDYQTSVLVVTAVVICAAIIGFTLAAVHDSRKKSRLVLSGTPVPGEVIAVELRTGFDRERGRTNVMMKLRYTDPHTGQETTIRYATQPSREMPSRLNALGAGVAEVSGMAAGFRRVKEFRAGLIAEGLTKEEVKAKTREFALKMSTDVVDAERAHGFDADGFRVLEPIPVTVYVGDESSDFVVVF